MNSRTAFCLFFGLAILALLISTFSDFDMSAGIPAQKAIELKVTPQGSPATQPVAPRDGGSPVKTKGFPELPPNHELMGLVVNPDAKETALLEANGFTLTPFGDEAKTFAFSREVKK